MGVLINKYINSNGFSFNVFVFCFLCTVFVFRFPLYNYETVKLTRTFSNFELWTLILTFYSAITEYTNILTQRHNATCSNKQQSHLNASRRSECSDNTKWTDDIMARTQRVFLSGFQICFWQSHWFTFISIHLEIPLYFSWATGTNLTEFDWFTFVMDYSNGWWSLGYPFWGCKISQWHLDSTL